jgi:hypothetical protein
MPPKGRWEAQKRVSGVLAVAQDLGKPVPAVTPEDTITGSQAIAIGHDILGELFAAMRD